MNEKMPKDNWTRVDSGRNKAILKRKKLKQKRISKMGCSFLSFLHFFSNMFISAKQTETSRSEAKFSKGTIQRFHKTSKKADKLGIHTHVMMYVYIHPHTQTHTVGVEIIGEGIVMVGIVRLWRRRGVQHFHRRQRERKPVAVGRHFRDFFLQNLERNWIIYNLGLVHNLKKKWEKEREESWEKMKRGIESN